MCGSRYRRAARPLSEGVGAGHEPGTVEGQGRTASPARTARAPRRRRPTTLEQSAAVRLFVDRASAVRPAFSLEDPGDRDAVVELCRRLDGIPLALELAAARSALLAPRALLDRIGTALDLGAGASDLPGRQRTLRDTLAWSLHLLSAAQSALLARLSVFVAPWTLSDAEAVADPAGGDVLDDVAGLVENNLVAPVPDAPGEPRFRLYETVRAYAAELLDEPARDQVETAYLERLTGQALELSIRIRTQDYERWMAEFRRVWPDLRRAWELALRRSDAERTCLASMSLLPLWLDGGLLKANDLIAPSIRLADEAKPARHGELLFECALALFHLADYDRAGQFLNRIGADVPPPEDPDMVAGTPLVLSYVAVAAGDLDTCERELRRSLELLESRPGGGGGWAAAFVHNGFGELLAVRGDIAGAIRELTRSRELGHESGNVGAEMQALVFEAGLDLTSERQDQARELLESACDLVELQPFYEGNAYCLEAVAAYVAGCGYASEAARLLGLARALRDLVGAHIWALLDPTSARIHDTVRSALDGPSFDAAFAEGRTLDPHTGAAQCRAALGLTIARAGHVAASGPRKPVVGDGHADAPVA
jgi:predicted ATPase